MTSTQRLKLLTNMVKEEGYEGTARKMAKYIEEFNPSHGYHRRSRHVGTVRGCQANLHQRQGLVPD